ncbi:hypothetical protein F5888DRAFT_1806889 [Russula emetica]|nr:hypothetical protein F5888DRAFT_1806889 [Russula emetica]
MSIVLQEVRGQGNPTPRFTTQPNYSFPHHRLNLPQRYPEKQPSFSSHAARQLRSSDERRHIRGVLLAGSDLISTVSEPGVWSEEDFVYLSAVDSQYDASSRPVIDYIEEHDLYIDDASGHDKKDKEKEWVLRTTPVAFALLSANLADPTLAYSLYNIPSPSSLPSRDKIVPACAGKGWSYHANGQPHHALRSSTDNPYLCVKYSSNEYGWSQRSLDLEEATRPRSNISRQAAPRIPEVYDALRQGGAPTSSWNTVTLPRSGEPSGH